MTLSEAIASTTDDKPYIQSPRLAALDLKLKPVDGNKFEVYFDGELARTDYQIQSFELEEQWVAVE